MNRSMISLLRRIWHQTIMRVQQIIDFICCQVQRQAFIQAARSIPHPPLANLALRSGSTILVVSAHADDEALGCLGLLQEHHTYGCNIVWLVLTDGRNATGGQRSTEETAAKRFNEAQVIQKAFGWQACHWWGIPCPATYSEDICVRLTNFIADINPDLIYAPFAYNHHPEHRLAATLVAEATRETVPIRWYAIQTPLTPIFTTAVYASSELTRQTKDALRIYQSQHYMWRSFYAALCLQQLEGLLYSQMTPVTAICELPTERRAMLIRALATAAEAETPCKPNRSFRLWSDYLHLWAQATRVSETIGFHASPRRVIP